MPTYKGYDVNASGGDDLIYAFKDPTVYATTYTIHANGGDDKIYGPYRNETTGGIRQIFGGDGDDSIQIGSGAAEDCTGLTIDGGAGFDRLILKDNLSGFYDFTEAAITSIEYIYFRHDLTMKIDDLLDVDGTNKVILKAAGADTEKLTLALDDIYDTATIDLSKFIIRNFGPDRVLQIGHAPSELLSGGSAQLFIGSRYNDSFFERNASAKVYGGLGNDRLSGSGLLSGGDGDDQLFGGGSVNSVMRGGSGNDTLNFSGGKGYVDGGAGNDTYFGVWSSDVKVVERAGGGTDTVITRTDFILPEHFENLTLFVSGTALKLTGNDAANVITNGLASYYSHDVTIDGKGGSDTLIGGSAGSGRDTFVFSTALGPDNVDTITSFGSRAYKPATSDTIALDHNIFSTLPIGVLSVDAFYAGTAAHDADDRIIWNSVTKTLYYDADGSGTAFDQIAFAKVSSGLLISDDIRII